VAHFGVCAYTKFFVPLLWQASRLPVGEVVVHGAKSDFAVHPPSWPFTFSATCMEENSMTSEERERMLELCRQIAVEKDQEKFLQLIAELDAILEPSPGRLPNVEMHIVKH
jgi:hypothetical protein